MVLQCIYLKEYTGNCKIHVYIFVDVKILKCIYRKYAGSKIYYSSIYICCTTPSRWVLMLNYSIKNNKGIIYSISVDFVSAPFMMDRINLYEGYEDPTHFFRPAIRSMLVSLCCNTCSKIYIPFAS